jgi:hypothetical protein
MAGSEEPPSRGATRERARGVELVADNTAGARPAADSPSASLRPGSPKRASRRIATSPSDVTPTGGAQYAIAVLGRPPFDRHRSRNPRHAARPFGGRSRDRKRSGADEATAFPQAAASDAARPPSRPKAETEKRVHEQPVMTTTCGRRDNPIHQERRPAPSEDGWPASHSRNRRHLPEVLCLSAESDAPIVARWIASPAPSALRVSHPLDGFVPAHPRGCISSHIRP